MFKPIQSPLNKPLNTHVINEHQSQRITYPRYSSVDQNYSRPNSNMNSSKFDSILKEKKGPTTQKTNTLQKQRAHSHKKLTLTTAQPQNPCYNSSLNASQNPNLINAKQAYEGFKKNLQLKTLKTNNAPLQKRSKLTTNRFSYQPKFPTSSSSIRIQSDPVILQNENEQDNMGCSINFIRQRNSYRGDLNENNMGFAMSSQSYFTPVIQTTPNSPVHQGMNRNFSTEVKNNNNDNFMKYCQQKISQIKDQTQKILIQNNNKIKQLQSLLYSNKQKLQQKEQNIRQLELKLVLKQTTKKPSYDQNSTGIQGHQRGNSFDFKNNQISFGKSQQFLNSKISDLEKKIEVISKHYESQQKLIDQKIDKMNQFMQSFVSVKFHNLKFTLKTFVTKTQQKINKVLDSIFRVEDIVKLNQIDEYERIYLKAKQFTESIRKLSEVKVLQKVHFDDMKTTMNTAIEICKHKPTKSTYQNMLESREINESFWNNMEDFSQNKNQQLSFTEDSFSYAPGLNSNGNFKSTNNSSVNEFALGSFPSFSKFSSNINKEAFQSIKSSFTQSQIGCIRTIEEISKCRQGPINIYIDKNGSIRYKSSQSYLFDRRGNILKPTQQQIEYCLNMGWITIN